MKKFLHSTFTGLIVITAIVQPLSSQTLFKDLTTGMEGTYPAGSYPENFTNVGNVMYFGAKDKVTGSPTIGYQLYKTDGTPAGTTMLKVLGYNTGLNNLISGFFDFNGVTTFVSKSNGGGADLWKTDGTAVGTTLIKSFLASNFANDVPQGFCSAGTTMFFSANNGNGVELWKSDGTTAGTMEVMDLYTGSNPPPFGPNSGVITYATSPRMTAFNGKVYFSGNNGTTAGLYMSDGTVGGTTLVKAITSPGFDFFKTFNGQLFFNDGNGLLWKSDGTAVGTVTTGVTNVNSVIVFNNALFVSGTKLYKTDGTTAGTQQLLSVAGSIHGANNNAFYMRDYSTIPPKFYVCDGTAAGTGTLSWRIGAAASFEVVNNKMYATRSDSGVTQSYNNSFLWETDGTYANTNKLISFNHGVHVFNNTLFFQNSDLVAGNEPWIYAIGTPTTSSPTSVINVNEKEVAIKLFPNPVSNQLTINISDLEIAKETEFIILNTLGQEVKRVAITDSNTLLDVTNMNSGLYFYRMSTTNINLGAGKIIIK